MLEEHPKRLNCWLFKGIVHKSGLYQLVILIILRGLDHQKLSAMEHKQLDA